MKTTTGILCTALLTLGGNAFAEGDAEQNGPFQPGWYVAPIFSHTKADSGRQTGDGSGWALALGHRGDFGALELAGIYTTLGDAKLSGGSLSLVVGPFFEQRFLARFFGIVGFGVFQREDHPGFDEDDTTIFGDAGLGYLHPLPWQPFGFSLNARAEARYRYDVQQPPRPEGTPAFFEDYVFNLGVQVPLSRAPKPVPEVPDEPVSVVPPVSTDADGDGVDDDADQCPGTPWGTVVDDTGCPSPTGAKPAGEATLATAQPGDAVVLKGVNFEFNQATFTSESIELITVAAEQLQARPELRIEIGGHTDSSGDDMYNLDLSQRRAEAVRNYLVDLGIDPARLTAVGYGETQPVDTNQTSAGRALNRRVELKILD